MAAVAKRGAKRMIPLAKKDMCSCSCSSCPTKPAKGEKITRITRPEMFVEILGTVKKRSTCARAQVSALIVKENRIISMGYGGSPSGLPHCLDVGCLIGDSGGCIRTIHAEANAVAFAARHGIAIEGADLWCSMSPCLDCAKLLINSGISCVFYLEPYRKRDGLKLLIEAGIKVYHYTHDRVDRVSC